MKRVSFVRSIVRTAATTLLCLGLAAAGFAATNPLNEPNGLAVDASGNLYVANTGTNSILVFNSKYKLQSTKTITQGVNHPTAVAVDPIGNVWVANYAQNGGSITEYAGTKQNTGATITEGVSSPLALAIDGMGNVWVQNAESYVDVYAQPLTVFGPGTPALVQTFNTGATLYGIAVQENTVALATTNLGVGFASALSTISSGAFNASASAGNDSGIALASDGQGDFYIANFDGSVWIVYTNATEDSFLQLDFTPAGMAIDKVNGRVYFSFFQGNEILVYSTTTGALLETIK